MADLVVDDAALPWQASDYILVALLVAAMMILLRKIGGATVWACMRKRRALADGGRAGATHAQQRPMIPPLLRQWLLQTISWQTAALPVASFTPIPTICWRSDKKAMNNKEEQEEDDEEEIKKNLTFVAALQSKPNGHGELG